MAGCKSTLLALALLVAVCCSDPVQGTEAPCLQPDGAEVPFPSWVFGHVVWENESTTEGTYELVSGYRERGIPVDVVILDSPWETEYNTLEFDAARYPEADRLIRDLQGLGTRVLLWITSYINLEDPGYGEALERGFFLPGFERQRWWKGVGGLLDYGNPEAVAWWHRRLDRALALGIDGWKVDFADLFVLKRGWKGLGQFLERNRRAHADYAAAYYSDFYDYTRHRTDRKTVIMARPMVQTLNEYNFETPWWTNPFELGPFTRFAPVDKSFMAWVGDQPPTFTGLRVALRNILRSAKEGYLVVGSDIGGFVNGHRTQELFLRWTQLGAFSPLMENGGAGEHRPWMFDRETLDVYRAYALLHLALGPYLYSEAVRAWRDGKSLISPLEVGDRQYLLGHDILVAPIISPGGRRKVVLPEGSNWRPLLYTERGEHPLLSGGLSFTRRYALDEYPVFVRAGALIPIALDEGRELFGELTAPPSEGALLVVPPADNESFRVEQIVYRECKPAIRFAGRMAQSFSGFEHTIQSVHGDLPVLVLGDYAPLRSLPGPARPKTQDLE